MDIHARDELWTDHDGQSRVMDYDAVEKELNRLEAENERLRAALESCESWIDRWTNHVGTCKGGDKCTCGRTAILFEAKAALAFEQKESR
jgi:uncharacterized Fe-S radical SAM superfamily protein PflX